MQLDVSVIVVLDKTLSLSRKIAYVARFPVAKQNKQEPVQR